MNPRDRFLSFTIAGSVLDDVSGAPDDAFEVALLDAKTGLSLAGALSLTHTDAMLNLQAGHPLPNPPPGGEGTNGTLGVAQTLDETAASSVTRVTNPDGSRTYRVDLAGIAVGTAVNLSFDLIGFGKNNSEVTIRDVRVSGLPELHDDAVTMNEDGSLAFDPFAQVDNAALLQLGSHVVDQPAHGTVTVNTDGTFAYTPAADYFGTDTFTYRLNDGPLESNLATVSVSIAAVNDAPVAADVYATLAEDTPLLITLGNFASDVDSTTLSIQIVAGPTHGILVANADGSYTYTPNANYNGPDSFTYKANDSELDSNIATVNLNITPVNDAPVANDVAVYTLEDNTLVLDLRNSATDVDNPSPQPSPAGGEGAVLFTATIVAAPAHGVLTQNTDGTYTYTPDANYNGADSFTYRVNDAAFAGDPSALDSNIATVSLTVGAVNDAPTGTRTTVTTLEDTPYIFRLADFGYSDANDLVGAQASRLQADGTSAIQWDSFIAVTISTLPAAGNLTLNGQAVVAGQSVAVTDIAAGLMVFAPAANANGASYASFSFNVQDDGGVANGGVYIDQTARTLTVDVTAVNDAPVAVDLNFTTDEDVPLTLNLLASVVDVDSTTLSAILVAGPTHGRLIQNADGTFNYLSDPDYFGADSFTYKANDAAFAGDVSALDSNIVTVSLTIAPVNDAPVAVSAIVTGTEDTPYLFNWSDFRVSDVDSDNLFIIINELQSYGALQYHDGLLWAAVTAGQRISRADIDTGLLRFVPGANESCFTPQSSVLSPQSSILSPLLTPASPTRQTTASSPVLLPA